ncbi:MAG: hypothetical protein U1F43_19205 [Myxococcota bacterium]
MGDQVDIARALTRRYLDPSSLWSGDDDRRLRALCAASPEAAAAYNRAVARHRAMLGQSPAVPSGFELARMARAAVDLAGASDDVAVATSTRRRWLAWLMPLAGLAAAAAAVLIALPGVRQPDPDSYIGARGLPASGLPDRRAGLGIGAVTDDGREYEAIYSHAVHLDDWLRLSFTNERPELAYLFVFAIQPERPEGERVVWIAPTPDEARSLPVSIARFHQLPFEVHLAARHVAGPVRFVALFTEQPISVDAMTLALDPTTTQALPSGEMEARLRDRLRLSPRDVVQVLETRVVSGSAADDLPALPGKEANPP